ncbi:MAG TPA: NCS2 family permease [Verrucomicrobiae bacterium]|nr:NCS2 family permease [Verrucomicrobiae bacterium]
MKGAKSASSASDVGRPARDPVWARGDIDGFFGLFVDNLVQLMLIAALCGAVCGFPAGLVTGTVLPGAAISILFGNIFYTWQARRLARQEHRSDVTALPFGINTPTVIAFVFFIMGPVYRETGDSRIAWQAGLFACFLSGVMETIGAFVGEPVRRATPRAALLSALAGVAITFIAMGFVFQIFASPAVALIPAIFVVMTYAGRMRLPLGLPGGLVAVLLGAAIAWTIGPSASSATGDGAAPGLCLPRPCAGDLFSYLFSDKGWRHMAVIFPMGLFNIIGSLQNLESAEAAGDRFETRPSLLANGLGTLVAALLGSAFPTTIYIGHPGWKAMGARSGYSLANGLVITALCFAGGIGFVMRLVPLEAAIGILLWIGLIITGQAFAEVPRRHAIAVALGLMPAMAAWAIFLIEASLRAAGTTLLETVPKFGSSLFIHGAIALSQGFLLTSMLLAAILVFVIDGHLLKAAAWAVACAALSATGLIHAYRITPQGIENVFGLWCSPPFSLAYLGAAAAMIALHFMDCHAKRDPGPDDLP